MVLALYGRNAGKQKFFFIGGSGTFIIIVQLVATYKVGKYIYLPLALRAIPCSERPLVSKS